MPVKRLSCRKRSALKASAGDCVFEHQHFRHVCVVCDLRTAMALIDLMSLHSTAHWRMCVGERVDFALTMPVACFVLNRSHAQFAFVLMEWNHDMSRW